MSTFWATMTRRRGSSSMNLAEATPSSRSSVSKGSKDDERLPRRPFARLAGQVRSVRLPPALVKGFRTASLPRPLPRGSDTPPIPAPTPEPAAPPRFLELPPEGRDFRKRAASASPSREEKKRSFRSLTTDRLPVPIRNLLRSRQPKTVPLEKLPPKPSRRPGPVGKTWVKVYDDITYMDDSSAHEMVPILGYTGFPTSVPDAEPLPVPPTPPPQRTNLKFDSESKASIESEYDNVPKKKKNPIEKESKVKKIEDKENIAPKISSGVEIEMDKEIAPKPTAAPRPGRSREVSRYKGKRQKRSATPIGPETLSSAYDDEDEVSPSQNEETEEVVEDDYIIPQALKPPKPPRGGNKTCETARKKPDNKPAAKKTEENKTIVKIEKLKVEVKPTKPKRGGSKNRETTTKTPDNKYTAETTEENRNIGKIEKFKVKVQPPKPKGEESKTCETATKIPNNKSAAETTKQNTSVVQTVKPQVEVEPPKPKRGIKIYETITIKMREDEETSLKELVIDGKEVSNEQKQIESKGKEKLIFKPKRGIKIYETIEIGFRYPPEKEKSTLEGESEVKKETTESEEVTKIEENPPLEEQKSVDSQENLPLKPSRGYKIYANVNIDSEKMEQMLKECKEMKNEIQKQASECRQNSNYETKMTSEVTIPLYARVHKPSRSKERSEKSASSHEEGQEANSLPPPIPPKKRKTKLQSESLALCEPVYDVLPPRPPRHLKPRPRSLESSPSISKRLKTLSSPLQDHTNSAPSKPTRGPKPTESETNMTVMFNERAATLPRPRSKKKNKIPNTENSSNSVPSKPLRHSQNRLLPAPPRRKKIDKTEGEENTTEAQLNSSRVDNLGREIGLKKYKNNTTKVLDSIILTEITNEFPPLPPPKKSKMNEKKETIHQSLPTNVLKENEKLENESGSAAQTQRESNSETLVASSHSIESDGVSGGCGAQVPQSKLDKDIENNLKNIENSFETIDNVIQSLKKYTSKSALISDSGKLACSDEYDNTLKNNYDNKATDSDKCELNSEISKKNISDLNLFKESNRKSAVSIDSELSDISTCNSDAETVVSVGKDSQILSSDLRNNNLNSQNISIVEGNPSQSYELLPNNNTTEEDVEVRSFEVSFSIKSDEPLTLPILQDLENKLLDKKQKESDKTETSQKPINSFTTETSEFNFRPSETEKSSVITTEVPVKLSTTETSEFKLEPSPSETENKQKETESVTVTEVPIKLSTTEISEFKLEPFETESKQKETEYVAVTEVPVKLSTTETSEFKLEPLPSETESKQNETESVTVTEGPVKLSTTETPEFKLEASETKSKQKETEYVTVTEVPIKLSTTETSEFKLEPSHSETENKQKKTESVTVTEVPIKLSTTETSEYKLEPSPSETENKQKDTESVTVTEIPVKLSTTETSEFKLEPSPTETENKQKETESVTVTEIPVKLSTTETSEFKLEPSPSETESKKEETISVIVTEFPFETLSEQQQTLKAESKTLVDLLEADPSSSFSDASATVAADKEVADFDKGTGDSLGGTYKTKSQDSEDDSAKKISLSVGSEPVSEQANVSDLAQRLEGIRSQLDAIITNYPTSNSSSYSSIDTALSNLSNRSSVSLDFTAAPESPLSFAGFYSPNSNLSQSSLCSTPCTFYTAATPSEKSFLTDSEASTPLPSSQCSSIKADDDDNNLSGDEL